MPIDPHLIAQRENSLIDYSSDSKLSRLSKDWREEAMRKSYVYNFDWLGRPIIQFPQDIVGLQEIIWDVKPDLIIETGIAHGGSLVLSASILALLDIADGRIYDKSKSKRMVLGIDIDIRDHNRKEIESHFLNSWITMIQGSSTDQYVIEEVHQFSKNYRKIMVLLDSNHTYSHVLTELKAYSELVTLDSYLIVYDTFVHFVAKETFQNRPWGPDDNPFLAVQEFLTLNNKFKPNVEIENKLQITVAPSGFLKRIKS